MNRGKNKSFGKDAMSLKIFRTREEVNPADMCSKSRKQSSVVRGREDKEKGKNTTMLLGFCSYSFLRAPKGG